MAVLNGTIVGPPADSVRPENHTGQPNSGIEANSRIRVTLQDVSLMDAPSVQLACQEILTGADGSLFPIEFSLAYDPAQIKAHHTYAVSARVTSYSAKEGESGTGDDEPLTWITMTRYTAEVSLPDLTLSGPMTIDVERI